MFLISIVYFKYNKISQKENLIKYLIKKYIKKKN